MVANFRLVTLPTFSGWAPPSISLIITNYMIQAYHVIFCAYGFWLPNDPRGSWSQWVRSWDLFRYGEATKVTTRRSVAGTAHNQKDRQAAKSVLHYPPVTFNGRQALSIAKGFSKAIDDANYRITACAILPQHIHAVIERDGRKVEQIVSHLKRAASRKMREDNLHPFKEFGEKDKSLPSPWARLCWKVFIDDERDYDRSIGYVEDNPLKEGLRRQKWSFVTQPGSLEWRPGAAR